MAALRNEVSTYLACEEYDPGLAESLLTGTMERVGALVSRLQGTFEFEVQPLREYFAARHLHKTAPYSPPGAAKKGTRPDRFAALASSFYWTNVTRFYCGFYDVGELPSLVDGLLGIGDDPDYGLITQPRRLAMMLLGDYVFSESPRSMRRLINFIGQEPDFERLTGADNMQDQRDMRLPETAGGRVLFDLCVSKLRQETDPNRRRALRRVMARNADRTTLKAFWRDEYTTSTAPSDRLTDARDFDLVDQFDVSDITELTGGNLDAQLRWLSEASLHRHILDDSNLYREACRAFFNLEITFTYPRPFQSTPTTPFVALAELLHPHILAEYFTVPPEQSVAFGPRDFLRNEVLKQATTARDTGELTELWEFAQFAFELMESPAERWRTDLSLWQTLVDRGFTLAPCGRLFSMIAMISTAVSKTQTESLDPTGSPLHDGGTGAGTLIEDGGRWENVAFAPTPGLVRRLYFARTQASNSSWWCSQLDVDDVEARVILLSTLLCWAEVQVVGDLKDKISAALHGLDDEQWAWFWNLFNVATFATRPQMQQIDEAWFLQQDDLSERLAIVLSRRLAEGANRRAIARKCFYQHRDGDRRILQTAAEWELSSEPYTDIDWEFAQRLSELARLNEVGYLFSHSRVTQQIDVPLDVARDVLGHCDKHHSQFVSLCERTFSSYVAQRAKRVSTVAEEERWFEDETNNRG